MRDILILLIISLCTATAFPATKKPVLPLPANPTNPEVKVLNETLPAGGMVQLKFSLTEPTPISTGTTSTGFDSATFDAIDGIQLFSDTGDVFGAAVVHGTSVQVQYVSPGGTFGLAPDYPMLTIAAHIRDTAPEGHVIPLGADATLAGSSGVQNLNFIVKPGTLTIGGSVSIQNVIPGGGAWPAGTVIRVLGSGFQKGTLTGSTARLATSTFVSPNEIDLVLAEPISMEGTRIDVKNPDGSSDHYFSYQRGIALAGSVEPMLNETVPIFSSLTFLNAVVVQNSPGLTNSILTGLAIQNPNALPATIQMEAFSPLGESIGTTQVTLPFRGKILRELGEYFGTVLASNSTVRVSSDSAVQFLGVVANKSAGSAVAFSVGR
jgi:hypothetical protein